MEADKRVTKDSTRAIEIVWLAIIFLVPLFFNPATHQAFYLNKALLLQFLVVIMLAVTVADWIRRPSSFDGNRWKQKLCSPLHMAVLIFGLIVTLSTILSITPYVSFWNGYLRNSGLLKTITWLLFFLISCHHLRTRAQFLRAVYTLLISTGIMAVSGILQYFFPDIVLKLFHLADRGRPYSTTGNALSLSIFLAMTIPVNLSLIVYSWRRRWVDSSRLVLILLSVLLVVQLWCLWLAQYSITILLFLTPVVVFILLLGISERKRLLLLAGLVCSLALIVTAAFVVLPSLFRAGDIEQARSGVTELDTTAEELGLSTLEYRVEYWRAALRIVLDSPRVPFTSDKVNSLRPLIGYGPETFIVTIQQVYPGSAKDPSPYFFTLSRPHNHYLYLATTIGVIGLLSFLSIVIIFLFQGFRNLFVVKRELNRLILVGIMAGMVGYLVDLFFNPETISAEIVFWLYLILFVFITFCRVEKTQEVDNVVDIESSEATGKPISPGSVRNYLSLVCILALMAFGTSITIRPLLADVYLQRGLNLNAWHSPEAIDALERATVLQPAEATYWRTLGEYGYHKARLTQDLTSKEEWLEFSISSDEKAIDLEPYIAYRYHSLADTYAYWAAELDPAKWAMAFSLYEKAMQLFPNNTLILNKWVLALIASGDLNEARLKLQQSVDIDPGWIGNLMCGLILMEKGDDAAQGIVKSMDVSKINQSDLAHYFIPLCRYIYADGLLTEFASGVESYTRQVQGEWKLHAMLAATSLLTADQDKGLEEFKMAIRLVPDEAVPYLSKLIRDLSKLDARLKTLLPIGASN